MTNSVGDASVLIATNDTVTFSGAGYQTVEIEIDGTSSEMSILIPPALDPNEIFTAAIWMDTDYDLDWHMFGPGNRTQYPTQEGVVNWAWIDKSLEAPYAMWHDYSTSGLLGIEVTTISKLNVSATYDFMLYLWSRVGGGDTTATWPTVEASVFIFGGSNTGIGSYTYTPVPPTPPAGFEYVYFSPFSLRPTGSGSLEIVDYTNPFDPAVSEADINANNQLFYPCDYPTYCPYPLP